MRKSSWLAIGAGLGVLTGLAVVALAYLGQQALALPFFPSVFFEWVARVLPGSLVTFAIDSMVRTITGLGLGPIDQAAKGIEQVIGAALWLIASAAAGLILAAWLRSRAAAGRPDRAAGGQAGAVAGAILALLVVITMLALGQFTPGQPWTLPWLAVLVVGWGAILGTLLERAGAASYGRAAEATAPAREGTAAMPSPGPAAREEGARTLSIGRREFLLRAGAGSLAVAIVAGGLGRLFGVDKARSSTGQPLADLQANAAQPGAARAAPAASAVQLPPTPAGRAAPAPGARPEITPNTSFYRIDIDLFPPEIAGASWQLQVAGLFDRPRDLSLQDLLAMPAVTQPITQSCISNPIGGDLIGATYYTGVRLVDVLKELGLQPAAQALNLQGADGFYESVALADMQDPRVLLVYGMNGTSLPVEHGYPLRIYIPNRYGMKQPKWITSMAAVDRLGPGYWVDRGWSQEARPQVISIIDTVARGSIADGRVPVGGIAWAGDRGIRQVEVQVDDGAWAPAELITPPIGPLTWVLWRYDWPTTAGRHTFRVRATDGQGNLQVGTPQDTYPDGATGYHAVTVTL